MLSEKKKLDDEDIFSINGDENDDDNDDEYDEDEDDMEYTDDNDENEIAEKIFKQNEDEINVEQNFEDEEDYGTEDYFQKIDNNMRNNFVSSFHPQLQMPSNEEIHRLTIIHRNAKGFIDDEYHLTEPFVTKYEKTHVIGVRTAQLENGAEPMIPLKDENMNELMIATQEFNEKVLPFIIWRPFPDGGGEFWKLSDLEII
jgi:DNA-directed RNA polymerase I, II, and III subunit RPABC2